MRVSSWEQSEGLGNLSECSARLDTAELVRYVKGAAVTREHVALRVGVAFVGQRYELADIGKHGCLPAPRPSAILSQLSSCSKSGGTCLLYTSPSPRDLSTSRMPSSA